MKAPRMVKIISIGVVMGLMTVSCKRDSSSLSLATAIESITVPATKNGKVDLLFVIDSSGSMANSQNNLASNFSILSQILISRGLDFHFAVTSTDVTAYNVANPYGGLAGNYIEYVPYNATKNALQKHSGAAQVCNTIVNPGEYYLKSSDYNLNDSAVNSTFLDKMFCKAMVGINGSGNESGATAIEKALSSPATLGNNADFLRTDSFLGVVILSDEDDASAVSPAQLVTFLDNLTNYTSGENRRYSLNTITTLAHHGCFGEVASPPGYDPGGDDYIEMASLTDGVAADICGDFSQTVNQIADGIAKAVSEIRLDRPADPNSISVSLNGNPVPNSSSNGFVYNASRQSLQFSGSWIPKPGDKLDVTYDPTVPII